MIHRERQWHSCDRCGRKIEDYEMVAFSNHPVGARKIFRDIFDPKTREEMATLRTETAEGPYGYISDQYLIAKKSFVHGDYGILQLQNKRNSPMW